MTRARPMTCRARLSGDAGGRARAAAGPAGRARQSAGAAARRSSRRSAPRLGSKPFRARQLMNWLYKRGCDRFEDMSDLAQRLSRASSPSGAEVRAARDPDACSRPATAPASGCCAPIRPGLRDGLHPGDRSRHAVHLLAGRLRARLRVLLDRAAGLQPQPDAPPRSSARSGSPIASSASRPAASASSPTWC